MRGQTIAIGVMLFMVACKGGEEKRKSLAQELTVALDGCTAQATGEKYVMLVVDCEREDKVSDTRAAAARAVLQKRCATLVEDGFEEVAVQGAYLSESADLRGGRCTFAAKGDYEPKRD